MCLVEVRIQCGSLELPPNVVAFNEIPVRHGAGIAECQGVVFNCMLYRTPDVYYAHPALEEGSGFLWEMESDAVNNSLCALIDMHSRRGTEPGSQVIHVQFIIGWCRDRRVSKPPVKNKGFIVATLDAAQDVSNLVEIPRLNLRPVPERLQVERRGVSQDLDPLAVQRTRLCLAPDIVKAAELRFEFQVGCSLVWGVGAQWDEELEWLFSLV